MQKKKETGSQMKGMQRKARTETEAEPVRVVTHYKYSHSLALLPLCQPIYSVLTSGSV